MQTKLTLRLDQSAIEAAKRYAYARDTSVSQLVTDYFAQLNMPASKGAPGKRAGIKPESAPVIPSQSVTHRLRGLLAAKKSRSINSKRAVIDEASYNSYRDEKYR